MIEHAPTNLTRLTPHEECLARVSLANTPDDRLRLGLSAVLGAPDGSAVAVNPPSAGREPPAAEPEAPGF